MGTVVSWALAYDSWSEISHGAEQVRFHSAVRAMKEKVQAQGSLCPRQLTLLQEFSKRERSSSVVAKWCFTEIRAAKLLVKDIASETAKVAKSLQADSSRDRRVVAKASDLRKRVSEKTTALKRRLARRNRTAGFWDRRKIKQLVTLYGEMQREVADALFQISQQVDKKLDETDEYSEDEAGLSKLHIGKASRGLGSVAKDAVFSCFSRISTPVTV
jgi:hypothetical protein